MRLTGIEIVSPLRPRIREIEGAYFLLTSENYPVGEEDGFIVNPVLEDIPNSGRLHISQFVTNHVFSISFSDREPLTFNTQYLRHKDTVNRTDTWYQTYHVQNALFYQDVFCTHGLDTPPLFRDAPFRELLFNWTGFEYRIEFETWFVVFNNHNYIPLAKFTWKIDCKLILENDLWRISENISSSETEIINSLTIINNGNELFMPVENAPHLTSVAEKFYEVNGILNA